MHAGAGVVGDEIQREDRLSVWLANQRAVEYHVTLGTAGHLDQPSYLVLDIDPPAIHVQDLHSRNGTYVNQTLIGRRPGGAAAEEECDKPCMEYTLKDGDTLMLGPHTVHVYAVPGHTQGSAAYLVDDVLFMGDAADTKSDGTVIGSPWIFSDSQPQDRASLVALDARLAVSVPVTIGDSTRPGDQIVSTDPGEPERYRKDVPNAEVHIVDGGHFALDTAADQIAAFVQGFVGSVREGVGSRRAG